MDVLDAGVYVSTLEAAVPRNAKLVLWGPLQAKEMGLEGWEVQDGGETGFVLHNPGVAMTMGRATSTLIFARRLERAFLTVYLGGYPADAPAAQRRLDQHKVVSAAEVFLTRLAKSPVRFELKAEITLVDNVNDAAVPPKGQARLPRPSAAALPAPARAPAEPEPEPVPGAPSWARVPKESTSRRPAGNIIDADAEPAATGLPAKRSRVTARGDVVDAEPAARKVKGKGKAEVWEV